MKTIRLIIIGSGIALLITVVVATATKSIPFVIGCIVGLLALGYGMLGLNLRAPEENFRASKAIDLRHSGNST